MQGQLPPVSEYPRVTCHDFHPRTTDCQSERIRIARSRRFRTAGYEFPSIKPYNERIRSLLTLELSVTKENMIRIEEIE